MPLYKHSSNTVLVVYHSINEYREDRIRVPNIVTPAVFEAQIRYFRSTANIITLQKYLEHVDEGKQLLDKSVVITFDDGYKDNLTIAAPILRKYGVPATFFVATGYIGTGKMKWEDQLSCMIRRSKAEFVSLAPLSGDVSFNIDSEKDKFRVINALVNVLGNLNQPERAQALKELREQLKVELADQADVMMTWDDIRQLANTREFSIGSHTVTHEKLTRISIDVARWEVEYSKEHIEKEIARPVTSFSYPNGDFNDDVIAIVKNAGYASAGTIEYGKNGIRSNPFRLRRVIAPDQSGARFSTGMWLRTSPFGEFLRKNYNTLNGAIRSGVGN